MILSQRVVSERYQISRRTLRDWKDRLDNDQFLHAEAGRPPAMDEQGVSDIVEVLRVNEKKNTPLDDTQLVSLIHENIHQSSRR